MTPTDRLSRAAAPPGGRGTALVMLAIVAVLALLALLALLRARSGSPGVHDFTGRTMGTSYRVTVDASLSSRERRALADTIRARLERVDRMMSTFDTASQLSRLNRRAPGEPMRVDRELIEVLALAADVAERSGGAFDPTVAPLVDAWGFGPADAPSRAPDDALLEALVGRVDYRRIELDAAAGTVTRTHAGTLVDLSAIAKGYGAEQVAEALLGLGLRSWLIEVGGELQAGEPKRDGNAWHVGIERPAVGAPEPWGTVDLVDLAIATSGDYRNFIELEGTRYAHIVDPRTGRPVPWVGASVSVVHERAALADAWATALTVLGPEEGWRLAVEEGLAALFLTASAGGPRARPTPAFRERVGFERYEGG